MTWRIMSATGSSAKSALPPGIPRAALGYHRLFIGLVVLHLLAAQVVAALAGGGLSIAVVIQLFALFVTFVPLYLLVVVFWQFARMVAGERPERPLHRFLSILREIFCDRDRLVSGLVALMTLTAFTTSAMFLKAAISDIAPFEWDPLLAEIDRVLHGGTDPWRSLMPVLGGAMTTGLIDLAYHVWLPLMYFFLFVACFSRDAGDTGRRYLVAHVLIWAIGGNAVATLFSSAGPVYYHLLGYGPRFEPLLAHLEAVNEITPVWALGLHELLWTGYTNGSGAGISAFPSMHLATSALMACYAFVIARWLGWVLLAFLAVIMLGSVHLAWHYAIDGYAGILIALGCWWLAGRLLARESQAEVSAQSRSRAT